MGRVTGACAGVILMMLLFSKCKKEYSYEGGTAVFSMVSNSGSCAAGLSGNYHSGVPLSNTNTVQLQVDVTTPGIFSLQTNTRAGILFSTSGSFADTGIQTITLTGTGTPDSVGDFVFTPEIPASCNFTVTVNMQQIILANYTLTGAPNQCTNAQVNGQYLTGAALTGANFMVLQVDVISPGDYTIHTDTLNGISFSASGTFSQTGLQTVTLAGSGNPTNAGNLVFTPRGNNGSGCAFNLTILNSGPPATYVIVSGQNLCVGTPAGAYTAGVPLSAANTYTLEVFVTALGNFTIATKTVYGIYFYYTGTFTSLGDQTVTLTGYGTPTSIGNFTFTPEIVGPAPLGGDACDFSLPVK
jgi:hypothetical protein